MKNALLIYALLIGTLKAQSPDPAYAILGKAYQELKNANYEAAIGSFRQAIALAPDRAAIRKDLAYTLLKVGQPEEARNQFAEAMKLDPADHHVELEYAFLCHETGQSRIARLIFDRVRQTGDPASRVTAEQAFHNIDDPLAQGIARWSEALRLEPDNFSAHRELARIAEQRSNWALAAKHYEAAWRLKPSERALLLDLGRVWKELGNREESYAALLAASRGAQPRVAEEARQLLGSRYPYVYEFRLALQLDPANVELRRELAYLLLEMGKKDEAETEFQRIVESAPEDLLSTAQLGFLHLQRKDAAGGAALLQIILKAEKGDELEDRVRTALVLPKQLRQRPEVPRRQISEEARELADRSYKAGYLNDALKYLTIAHEADPLDFDVMLKLGYTNNMLRKDREAVDWFALARRSPDPTIAAEAHRAHSNLEPQFKNTRTTAWLLPFYSSRWHDVFAYGQMKTEFRAGSLPIRPYVSMRFVGDTRGAVGQPYPQYLSEKAVILGGGIASPYYKGLMGWVETGQSFSYRAQAGQSRTGPDFRGGVSFSRAFGHLLGASKPGAFFENHEDAVYVSRFDHSTLFYTQNKFGYTLPQLEEVAGMRTQLYWNANVTADTKQQFWANFAETGPGVRLRWNFLPQAMVFSVDVLRGAHTINHGNPRKPNYYDIRAGFWYALSR
ncbi:MAG: tetratricopeptide repeat protein [Acidobacteriia bacterium]|nr:tetratricopeptide repeat protein [Terriglobia bacterium]